MKKQKCEKKYLISSGIFLLFLGKIPDDIRYFIRYFLPDIRYFLPDGIPDDTYKIPDGIPDEIRYFLR